MKKQITLFLFALALLNLTGCNAIPGGGQVKGSGASKTDKRDVPAFTAIEVSCSGVINITAQQPKSVSITGDDNIVPLITTEVKDNTLYIKATKNYDAKDKLQIDVANPDFAKVVFSGAGETTISGIKNSRFEINVTGAGQLTASGETKEAKISLTGAGQLNAKDLHTEKTMVNSTGVGSVDVYATEELDATATGVGNINYYGSPKQVNKHGAGIGEISAR